MSEQLKFCQKFLNQRALLWLLVALLLVWAFAQIDLRATLIILGRLSGAQIIALILLNSFIVAVLAARWKVILGGLGHNLPFMAVIRYRLAAFGVSYFTPGPQFGGEPLQVYMLKENHNVPGTTGVAAVTLDKMFDLVSNFAFLSLGVGIVVLGDFMGELAEVNAIALSLGVMSLPAGYLVALKIGLRPSTWLIHFINKRLRDNQLLERLSTIVSKSEAEMVKFLRQRLILVLFVILISIGVWILLIMEYWLALDFLGLELNFSQLVMIFLMARISLLSPSPGALGVLEAGQVFIMQVLGFDADVGLSMGLLIRARDVSFGALGLWWGGIRFPEFKKSNLP